MGIGTFINGSNLAAGQIVVIDINGNLKVLNEGDQVLPGEVIVKSDGSLDTQAEQPLQVEIVGEDGDNQDITAEIEDIFAALEEGQDPTQLGEEFATAAGGTSGSSLTASGSISRDGRAIIASTQLDTEGLESLGLSETQSLTLLQQFRQYSPTFVDSTTADLGDTLAIFTEEDTPVSGQFSATDSNGDSLVYSQTSAPENGTVVVNPDGSWEYTPNENYNGPDNFTVEVSDGRGGIDTLVVEIGVTPVNDAPVFVDENSSDAGEGTSVITKEDSSVSGKVQALDVDGDDLAYIVSNQGENGTVIVDTDGNWTYTPAQEYNGGDSFELTVSDGQGGTDTFTVDVTVLPVAEMTISAGDPVQEGDNAYLEFTISLDQAVTEDVQLNLSLGLDEDTATKDADYAKQLYIKDGDDYREINEKDLTLQTGETELVVYVRVADDADTESTESITLTASSDSEFIESPSTQGIGSITDDDRNNDGIDDDALATVNISATKGDVTEGQTARFEVSREGGDKGQAVGVKLSLVHDAQNGTSADDFEGTLQYKQGGEWHNVDPDVAITVPANDLQLRLVTQDDKVTEVPEGYSVQITEVVNGHEGSSLMVEGSILDDRGVGNPNVDEDTTATFQITGGNTVEEGDDVFLSFNVVLGNVVGENVAFTLSAAIDGDST
ncbi:Ig-like domain-containing protein, partial [Vibrio genomosp. F10]|uniref:Ig-like domain-containing protein n=1 Tax=Vibrio genomosp. F10 TaxID=723171 RepID=UPI00114CC254